MTAAIVPDDKDWTWVLERPCSECGFDAATVDPRAVGSMIRTNARAWVGVLDAADAELRQRPTPDRWSTLEYAAHVRDVHRLYLYRLLLMLDTDDPLFPNWDQEETAVGADVRDLPDPRPDPPSPGRDENPLIGTGRR